MNRERVEKYINVWLRYIKKEDLLELEKDINMPLQTFITDILENLYNRYISSISYIPVKFDDYSNYIIAPENDKYSLEDFLLNRLLRSVTWLLYRDMSHSFVESSDYQYEFGTVTIDKNRMQNELKDIRQRRKLVAHEILHGLKTQFYEGYVFEAENYFRLKEELKAIFGNEINDFNMPNQEQNFSKSCGLVYSSSWKRNNYNKYGEVDFINLDEILNELDAISITNDDYKAIADVSRDGHHFMVLTNPESSNMWITNYAFILEKIVDCEILFTGLYLDPETFYKNFNSNYNQVFQNYYGSNLSALEILVEQLKQIKQNPMDTDIHYNLLNVLYECIDRRYVLSGYNDQLRQASIKRIGYRGLLELVNGRLLPNNSLNYADEYYTIKGITR